MTKTKFNPPSTGLDETIYQWLEKNMQLMNELDPTQGSDRYVTTLEKIISEGQKNLSESSQDDPVLFCYLQQLVAEAHLDLALVEKKASVKETHLEGSHNGCTQLMAVLKKQNIPGLTSTILPRVIAILGFAYRNMPRAKSTSLKSTLKEAVDLLDSSLQELEVERRMAVDELFKGRFMATSIDGLSKSADRRLVLEKVAETMRHASLYSRRAFDFKLANQAEENLAAVEHALSRSKLPAAIIPLPGVEMENMIEPVEKYQKSLSVTGRRFCRYCGAEIKPSKRFCGVCGKPVVLLQISRSTFDNPICPQCGNTLKPAAKFCGNCGYKF